MNMNQASAMRKNGQAGFTLIELIVVIVILGILAATALPKFSSLSGDARVATLNAARGSLLSVASMTHGSFLLNGNTTQTMENVVVTMVNGYPAAAQETLNAAGLATTDYTMINTTPAGSSTSPAFPTGGFAVVPTSLKDTTKAAACFITYTPATSTTTGTGSTAVITVTPPVVSAAPTADKCV